MEINLGIIVLAGYTLYFAVRIIFNYRLDFLLYISIGLQLVSMIVRMIELRYFPIINIADTFVFLSFILMLFYSFPGVFYTGKRTEYPDSIFGLAAFVFLCISVAFYLMTGEICIREELKTILLPLHVIPTILGYAFFTAGFIGSVANIFGEISHKQWLEKLSNFSFRSNLTGNAFFGIGALIIGSVWAYVAWGCFWSWDAKETFSLITFMAYSVYLFLGFKKMISKRELSFLCIACYCLLIFTYIGVTFLIQGRHSYR